ncbi:MAG TPA: class I SAM-dependent methyltransferase [Paenibacillus sp.]|nr:class I SAM-dependent methyltransferase [Paenibacillus sp.]
MRNGNEAPHRSGGPYGAFAYVYDRLMADMPYGEWLGWLDAYWTAHGGRPGRIVDLGCGTGTIAIPLAQNGSNVTGVDLSADMIEVARRKEAAIRAELAVPGSLEWTVGDMREWTAPEPADAVVSLCDCLNYLTEEADVARAFRAAWSSLKPGGRFLFDMHHPNQLDAYMANEPFCYDDEEASYIWTCELDEATSTISHRLTFFVRGDDGRYSRSVETHRQRVYEESTIRRLLAEAGFGGVESYADFSFEPVDDDETTRMFFAATKDARPA